jgi:hypothetical protein
VIDLAGRLQWLVYHTADSRRSAPGFPDCVFVRERVLFAELKTDTGRLTYAQRRWLTMLEKAGQEVYTWRPKDLQDIARILALKGKR